MMRWLTNTSCLLIVVTITCDTMQHSSAQKTEQYYSSIVVLVLLLLKFYHVTSMTKTEPEIEIRVFRKKNVKPGLQ